MIQCSMHILKIMAFWEWVGVSSFVKCADLAVAPNQGLPFWYHYFAGSWSDVSRWVLSTADRQTCLLAWCARRVAVVSWQRSFQIGGEVFSEHFCCWFFKRKIRCYKKNHSWPSMSQFQYDVLVLCFFLLSLDECWLPGLNFISLFFAIGCCRLLQTDFPPKCQVGFGSHPLKMPQKFSRFLSCGSKQFFEPH